MSKDKQKVTDSEMNENSVNNYKIVFDDENKQDVKTKPKKPKRLTISSTQEAGTGSSGGRRAKTKITPPDAHAYVRKSHLRDSENTLFGRGNSLVAEPTKQPTRPSAPVRLCYT